MALDDVPELPHAPQPPIPPAPAVAVPVQPAAPQQAPSAGRARFDNILPQVSNDDLNKVRSKLKRGLDMAARAKGLTKEVLVSRLRDLADATKDISNLSSRQR